MGQLLGAQGATGSQGTTESFGPQGYDGKIVWGENKPEDGPDTKYEPPQIIDISPVHNTGSHGCSSS